MPQFTDPVHAFCQNFRINIDGRNPALDKFLDQIQRLSHILPKQTLKILFYLCLIVRSLLYFIHFLPRSLIDRLFCTFQKLQQLFLFVFTDCFRHYFPDTIQMIFHIYCRLPARLPCKAGLCNLRSLLCIPEAVECLSAFKMKYISSYSHAA